MFRFSQRDVVVVIDGSTRPSGTNVVWNSIQRARESMLETGQTTRQFVTFIWKTVA